MAILTISLCVPFTRHNSSSRCSHTEQLQSKHRAQVLCAVRPITLLSNHIYTKFNSFCYTSRAMYRSLSARRRQMQSASLLRRIWFVELCQIICWKGENLSSKHPTAFAKVFRTACTLETFITAFWVTFSIGVFEDWGEVDPFSIWAKCLFSCLVTFLYFIFVNLAWSVPITWHFSPCPKRVASTELLVFMYVNRFQKLHSKIFSACNYTAFFFFIFLCF